MRRAIQIGALLGVALIALCVVPHLWADIVTIDGLSGDWGAPDRITVDPDETGPPATNDIPNNWDIHYNFFIMGQDNFYFAVRTFSDLSMTTRSFLQFGFDTDRSISTGGDFAGVPGFEYFVEWKPRATVPSQRLTFWQWQTDISDWGQLDTTGILIKQGTGADANFVEMQVPHTAFTAWSWPYSWGTYLDNADPPPDDLTPNDLRGEAGVPEPMTLALGTLSLLGLGIWRRRRSG